MAWNIPPDMESIYGFSPTSASRRQTSGLWVSVGSGGPQKGGGGGVPTAETTRKASTFAHKQGWKWFLVISYNGPDAAKEHTS